jgi:hypothetical protein
MDRVLTPTLSDPKSSAEIPALTSSSERAAPGPAVPKAEGPTPLRAVHTANFPALLQQLGASLLVTTYQAGKLVMVRDEGDHLNTHLRAFQAPMGMALSGDRLAIGTHIQVWETAGKLVHGARRGAGRRADVVAGAGRTEPTRGATGLAGNGSVPRVPFVKA